MVGAADLLSIETADAPKGAVTKVNEWLLHKAPCA